MHCKNCGTKLTEDSKFCHECGVQNDNTEKVKKAKPKIVELSNEIIELFHLIQAKRLNVLQVGVDEEIIKKIRTTVDSERNGELLIKNYKKLINTDLIDELRSLSNNYDNIKKYLGVFIDLNIVEDTYPHKVIKLDKASVNKIKSSAHQTIEPAAKNIKAEGGIRLNGCIISIGVLIGLSIIIAILSNDSTNESVERTKEVNDNTIETFDNTISTVAPSTPSYSILEVGRNNKTGDIGFVVHVRISEKLSHTELKSIAQKVKEDIKAVSDKGAVFFLLPEMVVDGGAWATVFFDPNMKVNIIGQSIGEGQEIESGLDNISDYVGLWSDDGTQGDVIIRIRIDKKVGYVFEYISPSDPKPSDWATPIKKKIENGKTIFNDTEHPEQYFVLEKNGDLSVYDNYGLVVTYKKLK